jgi:hypothetical protein
VQSAEGISLTGNAGSDAEMSMTISNELRHTDRLVDGDDDRGDDRGGRGAARGTVLR